MEIKQLITTDNDILGGQAVFKGTRVPIESLFDHLEAGISLDAFLEDFPTVSKEQTIALLDWAKKLFNTKNLDKIYVAVAGLSLTSCSSAEPASVYSSSTNVNPI